jgi:hypothetical protein
MKKILILDGYSIKKNEILGLYIYTIEKDIPDFE